MLSSRLQRVLALAAIPLLLVASGSFQQRLNRQRVALGITRGEALGQTAPPVLVFTTVALGGFRGLIANALWIRAIDLQEQDKYFEKVQLTDWITKLQPHFVTVWIVQAWDMAYNISVKFNEPRDRWLWVQRGVELLRDQALRYNPDETLIYRELAWIFQHKIGMELDDAHYYYKAAWAAEMDNLFGTNYTALIQPQSPDEIERARILRERYKLDPEIMREIDEEYGPLEWRLPEAHAVYWSTVGFKKSKKKDLITLRRATFQPLQLAFRRGRLIQLNVPGGSQGFRLGPNLAMLPRANKAYERMAADDAEFRANIENAHRNFLKDAIYFLYTHNRREEAEQWRRYLLQQYPNAMFSDARRTDLATVRIADLSLDDYVAARVTEDVGETSHDRMRSNLEGLLLTSFYNLATDNDDEAAGYDRLVQVAWRRFMNKIGPKQEQRVALPPVDEMRREAFRVFEETYHPELVARLRTKLGLPSAPPPVPSTTTNAPGPATSNER